MSLTFELKTVLDAARMNPAEATRVETTTLLPGGGVATVSVRPVGQGRFEVSDDGAGREAMLALGLQDFSRSDVSKAREIAESRGLAFRKDAFVISEVTGDQMASAISYVADATRCLVSEALDNRSRRTRRDLISRTVERLRQLHPGVQVDHERQLLGASTKRHEFDLVMSLPGDRYAVFQTVTPAPASIAAAHLKLYDLREAHAEWPREVVVEDMSTWVGDDLAIMQQVASHMRDFQSPWSDLRALVS